MFGLNSNNNPVVQQTCIPLEFNHYSLPVTQPKVEPKSEEVPEIVQNDAPQSEISSSDQDAKEYVIREGEEGEGEVIEGEVKEGQEVPK